MAVREVEGTETAGYVDNVVPEIVSALSQGELQDRQAVESEIDLMLRTVREFWSWEPDQVMRACSAFSSRCAELHIHLHRVEGRYREWRQVRTQQVDRLHDELKRQHEIASRQIEVRKMDLEALRAGR